MGEGRDEAKKKGGDGDQARKAKKSYDAREGGDRTMTESG